MANYFARQPQAYIMYGDDFSTLGVVAPPALPNSASDSHLSAPVSSGAESQPLPFFHNIFAAPLPPLGAAAPSLAGPSSSSANDRAAAHILAAFLPPLGAAAPSLAGPSSSSANDRAAAHILAAPLPPLGAAAPSLAGPSSSSANDRAAAHILAAPLPPLGAAALPGPSSTSANDGAAAIVLSLPNAAALGQSNRKRKLSRPRNYPCNAKPNPCGEFFNSLSSRCRHLHQIHLKDIKCGECGLFFGSATLLRLHIDGIHSAPTIPCTRPGCVELFGTNKQLLAHLLAAHNVANHYCDICGEKFIWNSELENHKLKHVGEKFPCKEPGCIKQFDTPALLQAHVSRRHLGKYVKKCNFCDYHNVNVKEHVLRQHEAKNCGVCGVVVNGSMFYDHHVINCPPVNCDIVYHNIHLVYPTCEKCDTAMSKPSTHNNSFHAHLVCDVCQCSVYGSVGRKMHREYKCPMTCSDCNSIVYGTNGLRWHKEYVCCQT